ncbi:MAG: hypothetical protein AAGN46_04435 [Acidobacteriota bacterium]
MSKITDLTARAVYDSNGDPSIEVDVVLADGSRGRSMAPRGSTTGRYEVIVLEDAAAAPGLAAVAPALAAFNTHVRPAVRGHDGTDQARLDALLDACDETERRSRVGGNVTVATSMALAFAGAASRGLPLHAHLAPETAEPRELPGPLFNLLDGFPDPACNLCGAEFLVLFDRGAPLERALELGVRLRRIVGGLLRDAGHTPGSSAQGAWTVDLSEPEACFELLARALETCGVTLGEDVYLGIDLAGSDYADGGFPWATLEQRQSSAALGSRFRQWIDRYALTYLEDPFGEDEPDAWAEITAAVGSDALVVGDDLFASRPERVRRGGQRGLANAALIKPNQVGTVSATLRAMREAREAQMEVGVSQRSGENGDAFITGLAIAGGAGFLKAGGMSRMDRIEKYNELLRVRDAATSPFA